MMKTQTSNGPAVSKKWQLSNLSSDVSKTFKRDYTVTIVLFVLLSPPKSPSFYVPLRPLGTYQIIFYVTLCSAYLDKSNYLMM